MKIQHQIKRLGIIYFLMHLVISMFGQPVALELPDLSSHVLPPSPTAGAFAAYNSIPVNHHTGIPNINVPITSVSQGRINVPVSLSYHSNIKIDQIASWVGLGWSLNAGGVITRTVRGSKDEGIGGYLDVSNKVPYPLDVSSNYSEMKSFAEGYYDGQPDQFNFNMPGYGGKFVFQDETTPIMVPMQEISVKYTTFEKNITTITLTSPEGIQFIFGENGAIETSKTENRTSNTQASECTNSPVFANPVTTAWYLTKILDPIHKDSILFEYGNYSSTYYMSYNESFIFSLANQHLECQGMNETKLRACITEKTDYGVNISRIISATREIDFISSGNRPDYISSPGHNRLSEIHIKNKNGDLLHKYDLEQEFIHSSGHTVAKGIQANHCRERMYLESIQEWNSSESDSKPPHVFTYHNQLDLPPRLSKNQDHWGYFNGANNDNKHFSPDVRQDVTTRLQTLMNFDPADREVNPAFSGYGLLSTWQIPTGGYTSFNYEGNTLGECNTNIVKQPEFFGLQAQWHQNQPQETTINESFYLDHEQYVKIQASAIMTGLHSNSAYVRLVSLDDNSYNKKWGGDDGPLQEFEIIDQLLLPGNYMVTVHAGHGPPLTYEGELFENGESAGISINYLSNQDLFIENHLAPGQRIASIKTFESASASPIVREFQYEFDYEGCPKSSAYFLGKDPKYFRTRHVRIGVPDTYGIYDECYQNELTSTSRVGLSSASGTTISYSRVREKFGSSGEGGYTDYFYSIHVDKSPEIGITEHPHDFLNTPLGDMSHANGKLLKKVDYDVNDQIVKEVINEWNFYNPAFRMTAKGIVARELFDYNGQAIPTAVVQCDNTPDDEFYWINCEPFLGIYYLGTGWIAEQNNNCQKLYTYCHYNPGGSYVNPSALDNYAIEFYDVISQFSYIEKTTERNYDSNGEFVENTTEYFYNPEGYHLSPIRTLKKGSKNEHFQTVNKYPKDFMPEIAQMIYGSSMAKTDFIEGIEALVRNNMNPAIETSVIIGQGNQEKVTSSILSEYHNIGNAGTYIPTLKKVWRTELAAPKDMSSFTKADFVFGNNNIFIDSDNAYTSNGDPVAELFVDAFNDKNQITTIHKNNGNSTSNIWGNLNNNLLPIAQVANAKAQDAHYLPCEEYLSEAWILPNSYTMVDGKAGKGLEFSGNGPSINFIPSIEKQFDPIYFSGWVSGSGQIEFEVGVRHSGNYFVTSISETQQVSADWEYMELIVDLNQIRQDFNLSNNVQLELLFDVKSIANGSGLGKIDELKARSLYSMITTNTYNENYQVIARSDQNDQYEYYDYDDFSRLSAVRNFEGNLLSINEYTYGNINEVKLTNLLIEEDNLASVSNLDYTEKATSISFFDGLGRAIQNIGVKQSPSGKDVIQHFEYDQLGRKSKEFIPFTLPSNGNYIANASLLQNLVGGAYSYSENIFDGSPLNRVIQKSSPGTAWKIGSGHETNISLRGNFQHEVMSFDYNGISLASFNENRLVVNELINENGQITKTYTDKLGRDIMVDMEGAKTYTVYDEFGRVKYVIPPTVFNKMATSGIYNCNLPGYQEGIYHYIYDKRGNLIRKDIPGKNAEQYYYNALDQLVLTIDGNGNKKFQKYDVLGRTIMSGSYLGSATPNSNDGLFEKEADNGFGYTENLSFPSSNIEVHMVAYFDHYDFNRNKIEDSEEAYIIPSNPAYQNTPNQRTKGMPTGGQVGTIDPDNGNVTQYLSYRNYFDKYQREIQSITKNHTGQDDISNKVYNFQGNLIQEKLLHRADLNGNMQSSILEREFEYDHGGRMLKSFLSVVGAPRKLIAASKYDEKDQLIKKSLGGNDDASAFLQEIDYTYNIRGWMTAINKLNDCNESSNDDHFGVGRSQNTKGQKGIKNPLDLVSNDIFSMNLFYEKEQTDLSISTIFNGNINAVEWRDGCEDHIKGYGFDYDNHNQLTQALYSEKSSGTYQNTGSYDVNITYDLKHFKLEKKWCSNTKLG
jgi:YD repeat-containing protein